MPEEVAEDIQRIETEKSGAHAYIVQGERRTALVDSGVHENLDDLKSDLRDADIEHGDLDLLINTHEHYDHIGVNKAIQEDCLVAAHRYSAVKMVTGDDDVLKCRAHGQDVSGYEVDLWLENNALIDLGGKRLKVLHTPGHTSGSLRILDTSTRALITGDTVFAAGTPSDIYTSGSQGEYANSLRRLHNFRLETLLPGHGWISDDPKEDIAVAIETVEEGMATERGNRITN